MENGSAKVRYVIVRPSRLPYSTISVYRSMLTKIRNSGSRNRMPGNICVDSTTVMNEPRPGNRYRLTAYPVMMAIATEQTVADSETTRLFRKYRPSGTVCHMSTNGRNVTWDGSQVKAP